MSNLTEYILYTAIGAGIAACTGCSPREANNQGTNGTYNGPKVETTWFEPADDEPREKENNKGEYKRE